MARIIGLLPPDAVAILKAASTVGTPGSVQRTVAIENANNRVRDLYPNLFKREAMKLSINNVRGAFLDALFTAKTVNGEGEPAYGGTWLLPPDHPQIKEIEAALLAVAKEKWGAKGQAVHDELKKKDKLALHDGDTKSAYDGFPGNMFIATRSKVRPTVVDKDRSPLVEADGRIYSGCFVNVIVEFWAQDNAYGKRINAQLKGVQFVRDGDAFGGGGTPAKADDFGDISEGSDVGDIA
jgi:hypothetical protein